MSDLFLCQGLKNIALYSYLFTVALKNMNQVSSCFNLQHVKYVTVAINIHSLTGLSFILTLEFDKMEKTQLVMLSRRAKHKVLCHEHSPE